MMRKLIVFCFALLTLGVLLTVPAPVAAGCPKTCPNPNCSDISAYCWADCDCPYANTCGLCYNVCYQDLYEACEGTCQECGICCP